jgi:hypothetical protein
VIPQARAAVRGGAGTRDLEVPAFLEGLIAFQGFVAGDHRTQVKPELILITDS